MNKLPKEKRNRLVLVAGMTGLALAVLWTVLIGPLKANLRALGSRKAAVAHKLQQVNFAIKNADHIEADLAESSAALAKIKAGMACGNLYSWAINTVRDFKLSYRVDIPQFGQVEGPRDMTLLPQFPYKQAALTISGSALFHDLGKFLADFENHFPYLRIANLSLEPIPALASADQEKLAFKMDIIFLVKPDAG